MRIVIYDPNSKGLVTAEKGVFLVSSLETLETLIRMHPDEDIVGEILPGSKQNVRDLGAILRRIYVQKRAWYNNSIVSVSYDKRPHVVFLNVMEKHGITVI